MPNLSVEVIHADTVCYDMMYGKEQTAFNLWAAEQGAKKTVDGLGMLVGQAAESFAIWRGVKPCVETVLSQLRAEL